MRESARRWAALGGTERNLRPVRRRRRGHLVILVEHVRSGLIISAEVTEELAIARESGEGRR